MYKIDSLSYAEKLEIALELSLPKLGPEARAQVQAIINPTSLAIVAAVLVAWVASHAVGIGEIIDIIVVVVGGLAIGLAIFDGLDHLYDFAAITYRARSKKELEIAADHFAKAVGILGVQAVLAVLFRGVPKTFKGKPPKVKGPVTAPGQAYTPTIKWAKFISGEGRLAAGTGWTTSVGDIVVSSRGSARTRQLVLFHEKIHQLLTPKLAPLRNFRIRNRMTSYDRSSLSRYLEEALAETVAQVRVNGVREFLTGIRFPVREGYVYLMRAGADAYFKGMTGNGAAVEIAALIAGGIEIGGLRFNVFFEERGQVPDDSRGKETGMNNGLR